MPTHSLRTMYSLKQYMRDIAVMCFVGTIPEMAVKRWMVLRYLRLEGSNLISGLWRSRSNVSEQPMHVRFTVVLDTHKPINILLHRSVRVPYVL